MTYYITQSNPSVTLTIQIRTLASVWLPVKLLDVRGVWVVVDDGQGPLRVMMDQVSQGDWPTVATFERLREVLN